MAINELTLRRASELRAVVDDYVDASTRALTAQWAVAWQEVAQEWQDTIAEVLAKRAAGEPLTPAQITQLSRTQRALTITAAKLNDLAEEIGPLLQDSVREVVERTADLTTQVAASQMPPVDSKLLPSFTRVDPTALEHIIERSMGNIVAATLPLAPDAVNAMKTALIRAVPSGWGPDKAAREMLKRSRGAFAGGLTRAMTIARTELLDSHRAANRAQNMDNPTVTKVVWVAELDGSSCSACVAMHGTEYDAGTEGPEGHPNCRCTFVPKTASWEDLGFHGIEEPPDLIQSSQQWIDDNPHDALKALGAERYRMLMDGEISIADMAKRVDNPDWRPSYQATSIADLKRKAET